MKMEDLVNIARMWQWIPFLMVVKEKEMPVWRLYEEVMKLVERCSKKNVVTFGSMSFEDVIEWYNRNMMVEIEWKRGVRVIALKDGNEKAVEYGRKLMKEFKKYYGFELEV